MTSPLHRLLSFLGRSRVIAPLLDKLPGPLGEVVRELSEIETTTEVQRAEDTPTKVRAVGFFLGAVRAGASVRAVNVLKGPVDGGSVQAINLLIGDVLHGEVRAVNVIVGDVHGGTVRDVHIIVGDVWGGTLSGCYAVVGDIHGGEGKISRVIGEVHHSGIEIGERFEP